MNHGIFDISGRSFEREDGKWSFTFELAHRCPDTMIVLVKTAFRAKKTYAGEAEADAALKRSIEHCANTYLKDAGATFVKKVSEQGHLNIQVKCDPFAGASPEIH